tara:strand:+ start:267 stop:506 length:240 start_codon:yes stop_codon:yes gene_type:complete
MPGIYGTYRKVYKMFQIITKRDNLVQARGFKTKKDAINYLYCSYTEDCFRDPALGNLARFYSLYEILKVNDSIPISKQL